MKILESEIFNKLNTGFAFIQSKTDSIRQNSFLLSNIDVLIVLFIILTYILSIFASTNTIAHFSFMVPFLVTVKFLFTKGEKLELEKCNLFIILYLFICLITNFTSTLVPESLYGFSKTLMYIGFYFALCQFLKTNKKYIPLLLFVIACLISFEAVIGFIQNIVQVENISTWQDTSYLNPEDVLSRVYGTLQPYNPNLLAGFMLSGVASTLGLGIITYNKKHYKSAIIFLIAFLLSSFTIFLTGCRAGYMALFSVYIGLFIASFYVIFRDFDNEKYKLIWKKFTAFCAGFFVLFMMFNHKITQRLISMFLLRGDSSTSFRMNVYHSSWQMFQDNPIFGIGVGNKVFREIYGLYMLSGFDALSSYCVFLEMAVENGIFALIAYVLFLITILKSGIKSFINSKDINFKTVIFVCAISIMAVMIHGLFDTIYFRPQVQFIFWTMVAILTVLTREEPKKEI